MGKSETNPGGTVHLLLVFLAIPLIAFAAGRGIEWKLDSTLRSALLEHAPDKAAQISRISVSSWCAEPDAARVLGNNVILLLYVGTH